MKVLDFGLAKAASGDAATADLTQSPTITVGGTREGVILGTAAYMSPEQARGQPVDKRADIWAFGCVFYEMLTGRLAFPGQTVSDVIAAILDREPDWSVLPDSTPPAIRKLLTRCFDKSTRTRLRDIGDARLEIEDALNRTNVTMAGPDARPRRGLPLAWTLTVMVAAAAGAFAIGSGAFSGAAPVGAPTFSRVVRLTSSAAREMAPAISPDGKWVAYLSDARGTSDVWVQFIGGGQPINLTEKANIVLSSRSVVGGLEISPDGSRILFTGGPTDATSNSTYSVPAPLGGVPSLFLGNGIHGVRWSPDGLRIAYVLAGGSAGDAIWTADADGSNERPLVRAEGNLHKHWPSWSADGQVHLFQSFHDGVECRTDRGLSRRGDRWISGTGRGEREPCCIRCRDSRRTRPDLRGRSRRGGAESLVATARGRRVCAADNGRRRVRTTANLIERTDDGMHAARDA